MISETELIAEYWSYLNQFHNGITGHISYLNVTFFCCFHCQIVAKKIHFDDCHMVAADYLVVAAQGEYLLETHNEILE